MLRRALLLTIGCGAAAVTVPRLIGIRGGDDAPDTDTGAPPAPARRADSRPPADSRRERFRREQRFYWARPATRFTFCIFLYCGGIGGFCRASWEARGKESQR